MSGDVTAISVPVTFAPTAPIAALMAPTFSSYAQPLATSGGRIMGPPLPPKELAHRADHKALLPLLLGLAALLILGVLAAGATGWYFYTKPDGVTPPSTAPGTAAPALPGGVRPGSLPPRAADEDGPTFTAAPAPVKAVPPPAAGRAADDRGKKKDKREK